MYTTFTHSRWITSLQFTLFLFSNSQTQHFEGAGRHHTSEKIWDPECLPALSVTGEPVAWVRSGQAESVSCVMCVMGGLW